MWPFKRKPPHEHDWRLDDTFTKISSLDARLRVYFVIQCAGCGKTRTLTEEDFAHFRKYFNVKLTEVSADE